jgi:hypothetical protein
MSEVGGSIEEITLAGRSFAVAADADSNRFLGGMVADVQANGNGSARIIKTRAPWSMDGLTISIDDDNGDDEFIQELIDKGGFIAISITYASGTIYQGTGIPVDESATSSMNITKAISLKGKGKLTKQA